MAQKLWKNGEKGPGTVAILPEKWYNIGTQLQQFRLPKERSFIWQKVL